jgi:hypothetical protein
VVGPEATGGGGTATGTVPTPGAIAGAAGGGADEADTAEAACTGAADAAGAGA